ncbi:LysR family transcriptional regulator [Streptomyces sp. NPDC005356]|uniref:LysR family transcriptional regulator n=1 Tax=Streptomyces sp. NPDC005356 TaxID=3157167 RepID=UPI0033A0FC35
MPVTLHSCPPGIERGDGDRAQPDSASGIELRHLRAFAAVARRRSFTQAAEELLITQPALSGTVAQLEASLAVRLLERSSRGVQLTDTGVDFLVHVERTLTAFDAALAAARHELTFKLGFSWLLPDPWAQRAIARFERDSGAQVELVRCDDPLDALDRQGIDVALVRGGVRTVHLYDEQRVAVHARQEAEGGGREDRYSEPPQAMADALRWQDAREWTLPGQPRQPRRQLRRLWPRLRAGCPAVAHHHGRRRPARRPREGAGRLGHPHAHPPGRR